jgi:heterodisulfide reductase subunit C/quinone-modifying oxidoreductase subunit QmoC
MITVDTDFARILKKHGVDTALDCFNCGTCAAICPLIHESFPRRMIRYIQLGATERILESGDELWRCLHCGMCTHTCPRQADPGELILGLKRFVLSERRNSKTRGDKARPKEAAHV